MLRACSDNDQLNKANRSWARARQEPDKVYKLKLALVTNTIQLNIIFTNKFGTLTYITG